MAVAARIKSMPINRVRTRVILHLVNRFCESGTVAKTHKVGRDWVEARAGGVQGWARRRERRGGRDASTAPGAPASRLAWGGRSRDGCGARSVSCGNQGVATTGRAAPGVGG